MTGSSDVDGNETFQFHLFDSQSGKSTPLTNDKSRNTEPVWSNKSDRIVYSSSPSGGNGVDLWVMNPLQPGSARLLAKGNGNYLQASDWSPDERFIVFNEQISRNTVSRLWMVDIRSGERTALTPTRKVQEKCYQESPQFSRDGKGVYVITDCNSEFKQLTYLDLVTRQYKSLGGSSSQ